MIKSQKIWLSISIMMFIIPEIFFSFINSWIPGVSQLTRNHFLYERFVSPQFFIDNSFYLLIALGIECLGVLGFLIFNIKFNHYKYKIIITIFITLILMFLLFIFYAGYGVTNMSLF